MKLNYDCIRDILIYCQENIDYQIAINGALRIKPVSFLNLCNSIKYDKKDITYSVVKLEEIKYIIIEDRQPATKHSTITSGNIIDITMGGYQFLESIKPISIWEKTKNIANEIGTYTFSFLESVAHDVAVESTKSLISKCLI